jgi:MFS family permease
MASLTYKQLMVNNRSFRLLWGGQVVSELGSWFNFIAALGLIRTVTSAAPLATAIMLVCRLVPFSAFAPFAGVFVDRWSRRHVMIVADLARAIVALGFLLVTRPEQLWIAYACTALLALLTAFFEAAKNASIPNITGDDGLLAGNALMFSSRFLLMTVGAALGGAASASFGYRVAFLVNAISFLVSAWSIWLIPEKDVTSRQPKHQFVAAHPGQSSVRRYWTDIREGWAFIRRSNIVAAIMAVNILWAMGGGAIYLIFDRFGGVLFAGSSGYSADAGVAILYTAAGIGLFIGMMLARRVGSQVEINGLTARFIGWTLILHGTLFAVCGIAPNLFCAALLILVSRAIIGVEFGVQDTLLMRSIPDRLRGRVAITDRAAEILIMSLSTGVAGWALNLVSVRTIAVVSGVLSGIPGILWLWLNRTGKLGPGNESNSFTTGEEEFATSAS